MTHHPQRVQPVEVVSTVARTLCKHDLIRTYLNHTPKTHSV